MHTTMSDGTNVHAVTLPMIPHTYPAGGSVTVTSVCGAGSGQSIPARLARQASHPSFRGREVTCPTCLQVLSTEATS